MKHAAFFKFFPPSATPKRIWRYPPRGRVGGGSWGAHALTPSRGGATNLKKKAAPASHNSQEIGGGSYTFCDGRLMSTRTDTFFIFWGDTLE